MSMARSPPELTPCCLTAHCCPSARRCKVTNCQCLRGHLLLAHLLGCWFHTLPFFTLLHKNSLHHHILHEGIGTCGLTQLQQAWLIEGHQGLFPSITNNYDDGLVNFTHIVCLFEQALNSLFLASSKRKILGCAHILELRICLGRQLFLLLRQHLFALGVECFKIF